MALRMLAHIGLTVSDLERSAAFYTSLFGFQFDGEATFQPEHIVDLLALETPAGVRVVYLRLEDFVLELMQYDPPGDPSANSRIMTQTGLTHLSIVLDDPDAAMARVEEMGGSVVSSIGTAHMIRDPDGQLIELLYPGFLDRVTARRAALAN